MKNWKDFFSKIKDNFSEFRGQLLSKKSVKWQESYEPFNETFKSTHIYVLQINEPSISFIDIFFCIKAISLLELRGIFFPNIKRISLMKMIVISFIEFRGTWLIKIKWGEIFKYEWKAVTLRVLGVMELINAQRERGQEIQR